MAIATNTVSALAVNKIFANRKDTMYFKTPGVAAAAMDVVDFQDYKHFAVSVMAAVLVGVGVNQFELHANTASDGSGDDAKIVAHAIGSAPDAVGDTLVLECSAEQIRQMGSDNGKDYRYVYAVLKCANAGDKVALHYSRCHPRFPQDGLTADVVA